MARITPHLNYAEASERLGSRGSKKVGNNTHLVRLDSRTIAVRLHNTHVVLIHQDGTYTLNSGGYRTATTKHRIRCFSPARIYQKDNVWYVDVTASSPSVSIEFKDGMKVDSRWYAGGW